MSVHVEETTGLNRWRRYPAYRDSGVDWLGEIPAHWDVKRLKLLVRINPSKSEAAQLPQDTEVSFVPMENIGEDGELGLEQSRTIAEVMQGYTYFRDGDVILAKITPCFENGKGAIVDGLNNGIGFGTTELYVLRGLGSVVARFLYYLTKSDDFRVPGIATMQGAAGQKRLREDYVANYSMGVPPLSEQRAIAAFLDRKTGEIDALIAKKRELIARLQEQRSAIISHAVTRGLNPDAPMKDSGIEWLGEIPAHWEVVRFRRSITSMCDGPFGSDMKSSHYSDSGVRLIRLQNIGIGYFDDSDQAFVPEEHFLSLPGHDAKPGDLLVAGLGDPSHPAGRACVLPSSIPVAMVKADCFRVRLDQNMLTTSFAMHYLCSSIIRIGIALETRGATRSRINLTGLANLMTILPPLEEQRSIVEFVESKLAQTDALIAKAEETISRLQEYRAALISAAVTGRIDVREEV